MKKRTQYTKKIIAGICTLVILVVTLFSCNTSNRNTDLSDKQASVTTPTTTQTSTVTEKTKWLNTEELYYYQPLFELMGDNQSDNEIGAINVVNVIDHERIKLYEYGDWAPYAISGSGSYGVYLDKSIAFPFAQISMGMNANPFSNFNLLVDNGWVTKVDNEENGVVFDLSSETLNYTALYDEYNLPMLSVKNTDYPYTLQGCKKLLRTVFALENTNIGNQTFLTVTREPDLEVCYSQEDECYYTFVINCSRDKLYITALYFRSMDGERITEVTAQLMCATFPHGNYSAGSGITLASMQYRETLGKMTFLMSLEQALTGDCLFSDELVLKSDDHNVVLVMPSEYEGENYSVKVNETHYETSMDYPNYSLDRSETFDVYTYSLKLK